MVREIDLTEARKFVVSLMPPAGEILRGHFEKGVTVASQKKWGEITTQADTQTDEFLRTQIMMQYPGSNLLTEETAPDDYSSCKDLENLWVIDPLDGTMNFSRGIEHFAIQIALLDKGIVKMGVVYVPMENKLYFAQEDIKQAFLNEDPIKVSKTDRLADATFGIDYPSSPEARAKAVEKFNKVLDVRQVLTRSSAVADLSSLAEGEMDAYLNIGIKPWDMSAPSLFIQKAGGTITTPEGKLWTPFHPGIFASNGILHQDFLERFKS